MKSFAPTRALTLLAIAFAAPWLWGCASGPALPPLDFENDGAYRLDSGDQLRIIVFGQEELSASYTVDGAGKISIPLIPAISARGLTTDQLEQAVSGELEMGVVISPSVSVQIEAFRPFFILGEVRRPGQYPYVHGMTVLTAVAIAGGFTPRAEKDHVSITRTGLDSAVEAAAERHTLVRPGDAIFVHERYF
jgi:polysaccharide export outer membrane protein